MKYVYTSSLIALFSLSTFALAGPPAPSDTYTRVDYTVIIEDEGAAPYVEFIWSDGTFYAHEYADPKGEWCRGGSYEDLIGVLKEDPDDVALLRVDTNNWSDICPNGTYICVATDQEEPDSGGFCGAIHLELPADETPPAQ